jgi:hypothetical protein
MPELGTAFLGMGRGILEEGASTVWDGMGGGPRSAASAPTGDTTEKFNNSKKERKFKYLHLAKQCFMVTRENTYSLAFDGNIARCF